MLWRLPFGAEPVSWPPVPTDREREYPALQDRFDELRRAVLVSFDEHDRRALREQRSYRRFQLALIVGSALTSIFGAVQAALGEDVRWVAAVVAVLGAATAATSAQLRREALPKRYLVERAKAEELRSLYFTYLAGVELDDVRALEARVASIEYPKADDTAASSSGDTGDEARS